MGIVVDSGVFILWERRGHFVEARLAELDRPGFISVASASELLVGVHRADASERREKSSRFVEGILNRFVFKRPCRNCTPFDIPWCDVDAETMSNPAANRGSRRIALVAKSRNFRRVNLRDSLCHAMFREQEQRCQESLISKLVGLKCRHAKA